MATSGKEIVEKSLAIAKKYVKSKVDDFNNVLKETQLKHLKDAMANRFWIDLSQENSDILLELIKHKPIKPVIKQAIKPFVKKLFDKQFSNSTLKVFSENENYCIQYIVDFWTENIYNNPIKFPDIFILHKTLQRELLMGKLVDYNYEEIVSQIEKINTVKLDNEITLDSPCVLFYSLIKEGLWYAMTSYSFKKKQANFIEIQDVTGSDMIVLNPSNIVITENLFISEKVKSIFNPQISHLQKEFVGTIYDAINYLQNQRKKYGKKEIAELRMYFDEKTKTFIDENDINESLQKISIPFHLLDNYKTLSKNDDVIAKEFQSELIDDVIKLMALDNRVMQSIDEKYVNTKDEIEKFVNNYVMQLVKKGQIDVFRYYSKFKKEEIYFHRYIDLLYNLILSEKAKLNKKDNNPNIIKIKPITPLPNPFENYKGQWNGKIYGSKGNYSIYVKDKKTIVSDKDIQDYRKMQESINELKTFEIGSVSFPLETFAIRKEFYEASYNQLVDAYNGLHVEKIFEGYKDWIDDEGGTNWEIYYVKGINGKEITFVYQEKDNVQHEFSDLAQVKKDFDIK